MLKKLVDISLGKSGTRTTDTGLGSLISKNKLGALTSSRSLVKPFRSNPRCREVKNMRKGKARLGEEIMMNAKRFSLEDTGQRS